MPVRVLIVDDSAFMRSALGKMLSSDPEVEVAGTARDGLDALDKVVQLKPDLVTMDVEMPRMDGIEALRRIMASNPVPVIMVSSLTMAGAKATLEALEIGAVDFIPKNLSDLSINIVNIREILLEKVKQIGRRRIVPPRRFTAVRPEASPPRPDPSGYRIERRIGIVAIGTSTGGPKALQEVLPKLPKEFPVPVVVVQHMPPAFTGPFAERLNELCRVSVKEAEEGESLKPGVVFVAPGRGHMSIRKGRTGECVVSVSENRPDLIYRPSADVMLASVAEVFPGRALGVILTGMGNDGEKGMRAIKSGGGRTIAEDESTCVVYGMSRSVVEAGLADKVVPLQEVAGEIVNAV
ncbi:MAG: chemotaxis response regulator protein-glutamate methylesterase [Deltaproteobacteria bacterium]|nr:chemotaxis response regulator protein-glutamate methylesterase [Deltaproteobacteria bacterium]